MCGGGRDGARSIGEGDITAEQQIAMLEEGVPGIRERERRTMLRKLLRGDETVDVPAAAAAAAAAAAGEDDDMDDDMMEEGGDGEGGELGGDGGGGGDEEEDIWATDDKSDE